MPKASPAMAVVSTVRVPLVKAAVEAMRIEPTPVEPMLVRNLFCPAAGVSVVPPLPSAVQAVTLLRLNPAPCAVVIAATLPAEIETDLIKQKLVVLVQRNWKISAAAASAAAIVP